MAGGGYQAIEEANAASKLESKLLLHGPVEVGLSQIDQLELIQRLLGLNLLSLIRRTANDLHPDNWSDPKLNLPLRAEPGLGKGVAAQNVNQNRRVHQTNWHVCAPILCGEGLRQRLHYR